MVALELEREIFMKSIPTLKTAFLIVIISSLGVHLMAKVTPTTKKQTLGNGLQVVLVERREQPVLAFRLVVDAGSKYDPTGKSGLATVTAKMLLEGCGDRSSAEFQRWQDSLGAEVGVAVTRDAVTYDAVYNSREFLAALRTWQCLLLSPAFREADFENLRKRQITSVFQRRDVALTSVMDRVYQELFPQSPYALPYSGIPSDLEGLTIEDVKSFNNSFYIPKRMTLIVSGDFDTRRMLTELTTIFIPFLSSAKMAQPPAINTAPPADSVKIVILDHPGSPTANIMIATAAPNATDSGFAACLAMVHILGAFPELSILGRTLVEDKHLASSVSADVTFSPTSSLGVAHVDIVCDNVAVAEVVGAALEDIASVRDSRVSIRELDDAKLFFEGSFAIGFDTAPNITKLLGVAAATGATYRYYDELLERLHTITQDQVQTVTREVFDERRIVIVVWGDADVFAGELGKLGSLSVVSKSADQQN